MSQKEFRVDTHQLENLRDELAVLPGDLRTAVRNSLRAGVKDSLKKVVMKHYALNLKGKKSVYTVRDYRGGDGKEQDEIKFVVTGRLLSLSHFNFSPQTNHAGDPDVEIFQGTVKKAAPQLGDNGRYYRPFVMRTGAKDAGKVQLNVFRMTGGRTATGKPKLKSYRSLSVPQMLGNEAVADEAQTVMLQAFERDLFKNIERRTGIMQQNILKERINDV